MGDHKIESLAALRALHAEIDVEAQRIATSHADRLVCRRGCSGCCQDDLTVTQVEAALIVEMHGERLSQAQPGPDGACALLDAEGACTVYAERPLICRTQGLPLRFFFEDEAGEIAERRDICPLNVEGGQPLDQVADADFWLVGPYELRLTDIDRAYQGDSQNQGDEEAPRRLLRGLFSKHFVADSRSD